MQLSMMIQSERSEELWRYMHGRTPAGTRKEHPIIQWLMMH
jgi:hypothetical protein